jgi:hypothetical protein
LFSQSVFFFPADHTDGSLTEGRMLGSSVLLIASGLVLMYLTLALFCTVISEWVTSILAARAVNLERAIKQLIGDESIARRVLEHPLLQSLGDPKRKGRRGLIIGASYLPSDRFASALIHVLKEAASQRAPSATTKPKPQDPVQRLRDELAKLPEPVRRALDALLDQAKGDIAAFGQEIARWYDDIMDRASGWYRRQVNLMLFLIGFGVALVCNADTLMVSQILWQDQGRREAVAVYADRLAGSTLQAQQQAMADAIKQNVDSIWGPLPIGWASSDGSSKTPPDKLEALRQVPATFWGVLNKAVGILFTALAASLGAPFWFDLLQKITKVRASGQQILTGSREAAKTK